VTALPDGTTRFVVRHPHADWFSNRDKYIFPRLHGRGLTIESAKLPDRTLEVRLTGLPIGVVTFNHPVPPVVGLEGLVVLIVWTPERVTLYFDGEYVDHLDFEVPESGNLDG
jgi:hypothetical protein